MTRTVAAARPRTRWRAAPVPGPPPRPGVRWAAVYEFTTQTHRSALAQLQGQPGAVVVVERGYTGQTVQPIGDREGQHRDDKPWSDLIVGHARIRWQGWATPAELDQREATAIRTRGCRYNIEQATDLRCHVPKWTQYEQRWARDDAAGRPRWVPPESRTRTQAAVARLDAAVGVRPAWQVKIALWGTAWCLLTAPLSVALSPLSPRWAPLFAAIATAVLLAQAVTYDPRRPRRHRRTRP